ILGAYANSDVPGQKLIEEFAPKDPQIMSRLILFLYQNIPPQTFMVENLQAEKFKIIHSDSMPVNFMIIIYKSDYGLKIKIQYNPDVFSETTISKMLTEYKAIIQNIIASPEKTIVELTS
ncbi:MAG: hasY, partial [bacterium]